MRVAGGEDPERRDIDGRGATARPATHGLRVTDTSDFEHVSTVSQGSDTNSRFSPDPRLLLSSGRTGLSSRQDD